MEAADFCNRPGLGGGIGPAPCGTGMDREDGGRRDERRGARSSLQQFILLCEPTD